MRQLGLRGRLKMSNLGIVTDKLQVLRTIDKAGKLEPESVFDLLTTGRMDKSGAFIPGCGLSNGQAVALIGFIFSERRPHVTSRITLMVHLEETEMPDGRTAWDHLLDTYKNTKGANIGWMLDNILDLTTGVPDDPA